VDLALRARHSAQDHQGEGGPPGVASLSCKAEALLTERSRPRVIAPVERQVSQLTQRAGQGGGLAQLSKAGEALFEQFGRPGVVLHAGPPPQAPVQGRPQVVALYLQLREACLLLSAPQPRLALLRQIAEPGRVGRLTPAADEARDRQRQVVAAPGFAGW